jgi:hypothetical protein
MPREGFASPSLADFAPDERQGRVELELGQRNSASDGLSHRYVGSAGSCWTVERGFRDR